MNGRLVRIPGFRVQALGERKTHALREFLYVHHDENLKAGVIKKHIHDMKESNLKAEQDLFDQINMFVQRKNFMNCRG